MGALDGPRSLASRERVVPAGTDYSEYQELAERLDGLLEEMSRCVQGYSDAKAALEFSSERRREAISVAFEGVRTAKPLESATSAEHLARCSPGYKASMDRLFRDEVNCEVARTNYELLKIRVEVGRGRMAVIRAMLGLI